MKKHTISLLTLLAAFDNTGPAWKTDANGAIELRDGNPLYRDSTGNEMVVDFGTISRLNAESKGHREARQTAEAALKAFEGIDPEKAREALTLAGKIADKKLFESGDVDALKQQITQQFAGQINESTKKYDELLVKYNSAQISNVFSNSEFIRENIALPADIFAAYFAKNFKVDENGEVIAVHANGDRILSKTVAGEFAKPEEAFKILVEAHPGRDQILKANTNSGSGNQGGGAGKGGGRTMKRAEFETLSPQQQADFSAKMRSGEIKLID